APTLMTDVKGAASFTVKSTVAQVSHVTASVGGILLPATIVFIPGLPDTRHSSISAIPTTMIADGVSTTNISVNVLDAHGNAVPMRSVTISASGQGNVLQ